MPDNYKGKTKAEVRAIVLANNKNKDASDKSRMRMNNEIKLWSLQNRDLSSKKTSKKTSKTSTNKPKVEEKGFSNYGQNTVNKKLTRDETYSDYARSIRGEAPASDLYHGAGGKVMNSDGSVNIEATEENTSSFQKRSAVPKRGYIMKRNRK
tara:strand:- start:21 stop:476 length:456 start_codon:yes stop_codon:yes gene_type:complete